MSVNVVQECKELLGNAQVTCKIIKVGKVLGILVSCFPRIEYGPLFYRGLENKKIDTLKQHKGDFEAFISLDNNSVKDIKWWIENAHKSFKKFHMVISMFASKQMHQVKAGGLYG
jgi:hypothetical protein